VASLLCQQHCFYAPVTKSVGILSASFPGLDSTDENELHEGPATQAEMNFTDAPRSIQVQFAVKQFHTEHARIYASYAGRIRRHCDIGKSVLHEPTLPDVSKRF